MDNNNETIGLRVLNVSPSNQSANTNVHGSITVTFSADINPGTLGKNIVILEDYNKIYKNINSLKDYSQYSVTKGSIVYNDKILTYTPDEPFNTDACYVVLLSDGITDIVGNKMIKKHVSCFYTESVASFPRCEIISPKYGSIVNAMPEFIWKNQCSESYNFQIAKNNSFELLLCNDIIPGNKISDVITHAPNFVPAEGMYHFRVKSENGEWSDISQIFIKAITDAVIAEEDHSEIMHFDEFIEGFEEPVEVLEYFPQDGDMNVSLKTNIIYIKVKGKMDEDSLNLDDCYVFGETFDEEHNEYSHDVVDGKWAIVYDAYLDVTYIIFTPINIDDQEELEFIETLRSGLLIESTTGGA